VTNVTDLEINTLKKYIYLFSFTNNSWVFTFLAYRHPDLFVVHMGSIEIIRLSKDSYTKTRVGVTKDSIGTEVLNIPDSHFIYFTSPHILGTGMKSGSIVVSTESRNSTKVHRIRPVSYKIQFRVILKF